MNVHIISFGAPFNSYRASRERLKNLNNFGQVKSIIDISEQTLYQYCSEINKHINFISTNRKGYGFWIWKMFLVRELMKRVPQNDIICYVDMGCSYNYNEPAKKRFLNYCQYTNEYNTLFFELTHLEKKYTKMDTYFRVFGDDLSYYQTYQKVGGIFFLKNTSDNAAIAEEIINLMVENNYHYLNDNPSIKQNDEIFNSHRHDQSIISLISKKYNLYYIKDETWFPNWNSGVNYPILATRSRN